MKKIIRILMVVLLICSIGVVKNNVQAEEVPDFPTIEEANTEKVAKENKHAHKATPAADPNATELVGAAYLIFTGDGEMIFFRSEEELEDQVEQTVTINNKQYTGVVFAGIETADFGYDDPTWAEYNKSVETAYVAAGHTIRPISTADWFAYCTMTSFDPTGLDLSQCYDMQYMFYQCQNIEELDLKALDTSNVKYMNGVFLGCTVLTEVDISNWNTSNVEDFESMFRACYYLTELDLSNFDTSKVEYMISMFRFCYSLTTLNLSSFDTEIAQMENMFDACYNIYTVELGEKWVWYDEAVLPEGYWYLLGTSTAMTETELYEGYTPELAGVWSRREVVRLAGKDRIDTALLTASEIKYILGVDKLSAVVLAFAWNFPDALAGSYVADALEAPILLIDKGSAAKVCAYIKENLADDGTVIVLGGTGAIPDEWIADLADYEPVRLAGKDRFGTNLEILNAIPIEGDPILVCNGWNFADSLPAGATGLPLLLVSTTLTDAQKEFLAEHTDSSVFVLGGTGAVSDAVVAEIDEIVPVAGRIAGKDRYETSIAIAEATFYTSEYAVLAYAWNFPDGLSSGPLAYLLQAPILLVDKNNYDLAAEYCKNPFFYYDDSLYVGYVTSCGYIMGGAGLVTDNAAKHVLTLYTTDEIFVIN